MMQLLPIFPNFNGLLLQYNTYRLAKGNPFDKEGRLDLGAVFGHRGHEIYRICLLKSTHFKVPEQLMRWVWAGGRKLKGLKRQRYAEVELYLS
jgi:hypothetical protein